MQLQAVTGLPLGQTKLKSQGALMVNLLGYEVSNSNYLDKQEKLIKIENSHLHWYGKKESRKGSQIRPHNDFIR